MTATATRSRTARKVLGSLGVIGAAAAVAGLGTFGTFTDSTAPLNASVTSGTLALDLAGPNGSATLPTMTATGFVPGDSISRPVDLVNTGDLNMSTISMASTATTASLLTTDTTNGLQLSVKSCAVAWTESTPGTFTCASPTTLAAGPAVMNTVLPTPVSATAKKSDRLLVTVSLPTSANNDFQHLTGAISITFTGTQQTGTVR